MKKTGFFITKLKVEKNKKIYSQIDLNKGLNVISGPSETGKTYIYECINFLLGGSDPKSFPEVEDYNTLFLECELYSGGYFTIRRSLNSNDVFILRDKIESFEADFLDKAELFAANKRNSGGKIESLMNFLSEISGFSSDLRLKKNARNEKKNISFRDLVPSIMIDEELVISKNPTFLSPQKTSQTKDKSIFKLLLTGSDDSLLEKVEDPKVKRNKLGAKLEYINKSIIKIEGKISQLEKSENKIISLKSGYDFLFGNLSVVEEKIELNNKIRKEVLESKSNLVLDLVTKNELKKRFLLLENHYSSDLERIIFLAEGSSSITEIIDTECNCVLCGSNLNSSLVLSENLKDALVEEKRKIEINLRDLKQSISNVSKDISLIESTDEEMQVKLLNLRVETENDLLPLKNTLSEKISLFLVSEKTRNRLIDLRLDLEKLIGDRDFIQAQLSLKNEGGNL